MNKKKLTIYCDMDGVLADFFSVENAVSRFANEYGFFARLPAIEKNVNGLKELIKKGYNVKILSTSPHDKADKDKMKWLIKHIPEMKMENVIFSRPKNKKIDYITKRQRKNSILIDDYGKNTTEWVKNGGRFAIKLTEKIKEEKGVYFIKNIEETLEMIF